eukprot:5416360-Amphidinium_carterae.1
MLLSHAAITVCLTPASWCFPQANNFKTLGTDNKQTHVNTNMFCRTNRFDLQHFDDNLLEL